MHKLGALDAGFLYNETDNSPQSIASVQILELPEGTTEEQFVEQLKALLRSRIHLVPYFTNRLQFVPFDLDHPVWVRDRQFDINNHVKTTAVAAPGGRAELEARIAELHEQPLDRSRPLWDLWVLTGLEGGRVAYYNRSHHACIDGMAGQAMLATIMDVTPEPREVEPPPADFLTRESPQTPAQLLTGAVENWVKYQSKQPLAMANAMNTAARLFQRRFDPRKGFGAMAAGAPRTRFNRAISGKRVYASGEMSIDAVKSVAQATNTKLNDVFLAICAGALRRYFERSGELPEASLVAGCPVSLRKPQDDATNNQVTMMLVSLATAEADPVRRLELIAESARTAKGYTADIAPSFDADVATPGLPAMLNSLSRIGEASRLADLPGAQTPCNLVISNVPGPQMTLYSCGAKVLTHYPVSIPAHGQAANITVQSYDGALYFGITACARALPDVARLRDDMLDAFNELVSRFAAPTALVPAAATASAPAQKTVEKSRNSSPEEVAGSRLDNQNRAA